jgi:2-aminoethylphosphonate transport system substrate-binding protein
MSHRSITAGLALLIVLFGGASAPASAVDKLTLYSSDGLENLYDKILPPFEKLHNVKVELLSAGSGEILSKLDIQKDNPVADVIVSFPPFATIIANRGHFEPYTPAGSEKVPALYKDPKGRFTAWIANHFSWIYNPAIVKTVPETFDDLLQPAFAGKVAYSSPVTAGDGMQVLALLEAVWGEDKAFEYLKKLEPQVKFHTRGTGYLDVLTSKGEIHFANGDIQMDLMDKVANGMNIEVLFLKAEKSGPKLTLASYYSAAVAKGTKNPKVARALVDYFFSPEVQAQVGPVAYGVPVRTDVPANDKVTQTLRNYLEGVKIIPVDWEKIAAKQKPWAERWAKEVLEAFGKEGAVVAPKKQ